MTIHKVKCSSVRKGNLDRLIPSQWEGMPAQLTRMRIEILVENKLGVLRKLTDVFYNMRINIEEIAQKSESDGALARLYLLISIEEEDHYMYERLVERLKLSIKEFKEAEMGEML